VCIFKYISIAKMFRQSCWWSSDNYNVKNKKSAPAVIMKGPDLLKGGFTHPV
jgi:hypothetical protein